MLNLFLIQTKNGISSESSTLACGGKSNKLTKKKYTTFKAFFRFFSYLSNSLLERFEWNVPGISACLTLFGILILIENEIQKFHENLPSENYFAFQKHKNSSYLNIMLKLQSRYLVLTDHIQLDVNLTLWFIIYYARIWLEYSLMSKILCSVDLFIGLPYHLHSLA